MTRDEILNMEAGPRLDSWIAERVMGISLFRVDKGDSAIYAGSRVGWGTWAKTGRPDHEWGPQVKRILPYSTDWAAAGEVVEKLLPKWGMGVDAYTYEGQGYWDVWLYNDDHDWREVGAYKQKSMLEAICKAALLATLEAADD